MSGCTFEGPFDGGTYNNPIINDPTITNGTISGSTLSNIALTNNITVDDSVAQQLATALCDYMKECNGITDAVNTPQTATAGTDLPVVIVGEDRTQLLGKPFKWFEYEGLLIPAYQI